MLSCNSHKHISPSPGLSSILQNQLGVALDALTKATENFIPTKESAEEVVPEREERHADAPEENGA